MISLVERHDIEYAAMTRVAMESKISTRRLFRYFSNKEKLVNTAHQFILDDYAFHLMGFFDYPKDKLPKQLKKSIRAQIDYWVRNPSYFAFMTQVIRSRYYSKKMKKAWDKHYKKHIIPTPATRSKKKDRWSLHNSVPRRLLAKAVLDVAGLMLGTENKKLRKHIRKDGISFIMTALHNY